MRFFCGVNNVKMRQEKPTYLTLHSAHCVLYFPLTKNADETSAILTSH